MAKEEMKPTVRQLQEEERVNETIDLEANSSRRQHTSTNEAGGSPSRFTCSWFKNSTVSRIPNCVGLFFDLQSHCPRTRLYQVWPGKNVFFFGGRVICGPDPQGLIVTTMAIFLADWIFCAYVNDTANSAPRAAFSNLLTAVVVINLFLTSTRDPGIVPRNVEVAAAPGEENGIRITDSSSRRVISNEGVMRKLEYCKICKIHRPPRSCHCVVCDNCVERFDHHCPWISQCIGLRNYRYFLMFISSALVFFVYIFAFSWWRIKRDWEKTSKSLLKMLGDAPETLLLTLFSFIVIWFLGGICIFHSYLVAFNQTGSEHFKQRYAKNPNPHDNGLLRNIKEALFTRLPPSKVNFRTIVEPDWLSIARMLASSTTKADDPTNTVQSS